MSVVHHLAPRSRPGLLFEAVLDQVENGIIIIDERLTVLHCNSWIAQFRPENQEDDIHLEGHHIYEAFPEIEGKQLDKSIHAVFDYAVGSILTPDYARDPLSLYQTNPDSGEKEPVTQIILVKPLQSQGERYCMIQVNAVTTSTAREAILHSQAMRMFELAENLKVARDMADEANRAKSEFLALMSHELRTPLNAIIGFSDLLAQEMLGPHSTAQYKEYSSDIHNAGQHLLQVINDILDLSKIEAGKMELHEEDVDLPETIRSVEQMVRPTANAKGLTITQHFSDDLPELYGDARAFKQMLLNLISNAIKFTPKGGDVDIYASHEEGGPLIITVKDSGIGIAEEDIPHIMEPFRQADTQFNRNTEGTGLGVTLVKKLTELHDGHMNICSELGLGTAVSLSFPPERLRSA
ncbi:MAG: hypothetical protein CMF31_00635 [Kordiimonas sp.]|nr:hypothetical protein [Kordiimonas sp.]